MAGAVRARSCSSGLARVELLACVLALVFIAVAYVVVSMAIALAIAAVVLVVCLAGSPVIYVTTWCR